MIMMTTVRPMFSHCPSCCRWWYRDVLAERRLGRRGAARGESTPQDARPVRHHLAHGLAGPVHDDGEVLQRREEGAEVQHGNIT